MPASPEKNAYDILGLPRTATVDEIKKRYRELARKYHPDVNQNNPQASRLFSEVTTAYKTLSDANARAAYDAELSLKERTEQAARSAPGPRSSPRSGVATPPRTTTGAATAASQAFNESERLSVSAQSAFTRGKFVEAKSLAEQALRKNRRNALAYEVLGDVYRLQGRSDESLQMYTMALQLSPHNASLRTRFERMARTANMQRPAHSAESVFFSNRDNRAAPPPPRPSGNGRTAQTSSEPLEKRSLALMLVGLIGYAGTFLLVLYSFLFHGDAPRGVPLLTVVSSWNATIVTLLSLSGALLGATMTITGVIRRIDDELILSGVGGRGVAYVPMGLVIIVLSVFNFYVAAAIYAVTSLLQESLTRTMQRVFVAVVAVVGLLALSYEPGHFQVLLWGGNIVFLAFVIGWLLGDFFRPDAAVS